MSPGEEELASRYEGIIVPEKLTKLPVRIKQRGRETLSIGEKTCRAKSDETFELQSPGYLPHGVEAVARLHKMSWLSLPPEGHPT